MSKRFNVNDNIEKLYIEIPKALIYEPRYRNQENQKGLSNDAKLLYGILLDKTYLSIFKAREEGNSKFIDEQGDAFIYFDNASIEYVLQISNKKAIQIKKELVKHKLLEEVQQGLGFTNRLYLNTVDVDPSKLIQYSDETTKASKTKNATRKLRLQKWREDQSLKCKNDITVENTNVQKVDSAQTVENTLKCKNDITEMYNLHISKTDFSNTDAVVVVNGPGYKKIPARDLTNFEKIQINQNLTTCEKISEIQKIKNIDLKEVALLEKFMDAFIFISDAQLNMIIKFDYRIADIALDSTIAQGGESFAYFKKVYEGKEQEDINNMLDEAGAAASLVEVNTQIKEDNINININEDDVVVTESIEPLEEKQIDYRDLGREQYEKAVECNWKINRLLYLAAKIYAERNNLFCPKEEFMTFI